jgi:hypothetical protein
MLLAFLAFFPQIGHLQRLISLAALNLPNPFGMQINWPFVGH